MIIWVTQVGYISYVAWSTQIRRYQRWCYYIDVVDSDGRVRRIDYPGRPSESVYRLPQQVYHLDDPGLCSETSYRVTYHDLTMALYYEESIRQQVVAVSASRTVTTAPTKKVVDLTELDQVEDTASEEVGGGGVPPDDDEKLAVGDEITDDEIARMVILDIRKGEGYGPDFPVGVSAGAMRNRIALYRHMISMGLYSSKLSDWRQRLYQ